MTDRSQRPDTPCPPGKPVIRPVPGGTASPPTAVPPFLQRARVTRPAGIGYHRQDRIGQSSRHGWEG